MKLLSFFRREWTQVRWAWVLLAGILPLGVLSLLGVPRLALGNFTDSVFYLSYARQFSELVLRNGFLYYATRFGGILPDALSGRLFGDIAGIWILRWALASLVSLSLFLFFRRRYGLLSGLLASIVWCFNPAALRLFCTTYVDSTAVPFLIIGCCLFGSASPGVWGALLAGVLFGLATSAHLYATFALALMVPCLVGSGWANRDALLKKGLWTGVGFLVTWFLGWLWYAWVWNMPALLSPTIELLKDLGGGQAALWKKPTALALHEAPAWFAPVVLLPPCCMAAWKGSALMRGTACSLLASTLFFWGGDLFGKAYVLSMPFYYSFLLPVTVLAAGTFCGEILRRQSTGPVRMAVAALLSLSCMAPVLMARWEIAGWVVALVPLTLLLLLILMGRELSSKWVLAAGMSLLFVASLAVTRTGIFSQMLGHYASGDEPILEIASQLRRALPGAVKDQAVTRFWYDDCGTPEGVDRRMIGSFWLHNFGKLTGKGWDCVPFGTLDETSAVAIEKNGPDRLVIFDQDPQKVASAVSMITERGLPYTVATSEELVAASDSGRTLQVAILERSRPLSQGSPPAGFAWHPMRRGRKVSSDSRGNEFVSSRIKWWDPFAEVDLGPLRKGDKVVIPYTIRSGRVRFSLEEKGKDPLVLVEKWPSDHESALELTVPEDMNGAVACLRNRYPSGSASRVRLGDVSVFKVGGMQQTH